MAQLKGFYDAIQALVAQRKLLAYHDRSDGGLLVTGGDGLHRTLRC